MNRLSFLAVSEPRRLANLLRFCSKNVLVDQGIQVHGAVLKMGLGLDLMLNNGLIDMYAKCNKMYMACAVFDRMPARNVVSWTVLMCGHILNGTPKESLSLLSQMGLSGIKPNEFTFSMNLKTCGLLSVPEAGIQIHGTCVKSGLEMLPVVGNSIINMYSKCGRINEAAKMFQNVQVKNIISWNIMISGYILAGYGEKALIVFQKMQEQGEVPDEYTLTSMLKACGGLGMIQGGRQLHCFLITSGFPCAAKETIAGSLVDLYVKCGKLVEAQRVLNHIEEKNVISWSALILGYAQDGNLTEAMDLFRQLRQSSYEVDGFALSSLMGVFADFALVEQGKQIHGFATKVPSGLETSVSNSTMDMYLKCGLIDDAERCFSRMVIKNLVSWTVMITGYGKHGLGTAAIDFFEKMLLSDIEPDDVTYLAVISACSHSGLIEEGQEYFARLCHDRRIRPRVEHYACMVDLLGRAGRLKDAKALIDTMPLQPNVAIWQTLLGACRVQKDVELAKVVGEILMRLDGHNPVNYVMMSNIYAEAGCWKERERIRELVKAKGLKKEAGRSWVEIDKKVHFFYGGDDTHPLTGEIHEVLKEMERRMKQEIGYAYGLKYALHDVEEESQEESLRVHSEKLAIGLALVLGGLSQEGRLIRIFKNLRVCGDCHEFIKGLSKILKVVFIIRDANRFHRFSSGECSCRDYW